MNDTQLNRITKRLENASAALIRAAECLGVGAQSFEKSALLTAAREYATALDRYRKS